MPLRRLNAKLITLTLAFLLAALPKSLPSFGASPTGGFETGKHEQGPAAKSTDSSHLSVSSLCFDRWKLIIPSSFKLKSNVIEENKRYLQWEEESTASAKPLIAVLVNKRADPLSNITPPIERLLCKAATFGFIQGLALKQVKETEPETMTVDGQLSVREFWTGFAQDAKPHRPLKQVYGLTYLYPESDKDIVINALASDMKSLKSLEVTAILHRL